MKHRARGFSVFMVFLFMTALSIAAISYVRTSGFLNTLALARQEAERQYWAAYGLLNYASAVLRTQKDIPTEPLVIQAWPTRQSPYQGVISAAQMGAHLTITVQLLEGKTVLKELSCKKALEPDFLA